MAQLIFRLKKPRGIIYIHIHIHIYIYTYMHPHIHNIYNTNMCNLQYKQAKMIGHVVKLS